MKNTKRCPKCGGDNIVRLDGHVGAYGVGNNAMVGNTVFSAVNVNRYICCGCGFTEEWIDTQDIAKVAESKKVRSVK
jgi:ribosomal protein S27AE